MQLRLGEQPLVPTRLQPNAIPLRKRDPDRTEIVGAKGSIFYRAHSYHTKVPPEGIARQIEHYTSPGDIVVDPFCGSGMTGIAALMTGRRAVISDLSSAATHIASGYTSRVDPAGLRRAGDRILMSLAQLEAELYGTNCPNCDDPARVEYAVWSDVFGCAGCSREIVFWQAAVDPSTGAIAKSIECSCGRVSSKRDLKWLRSEPVLQSIACRRCKRVERTLDAGERAGLAGFDRSRITAWYPTTPFEPWREMWRGQHRTQAIDTAADFFTDRNLAALAELWATIGRVDDPGIRLGLRFAFTACVNRASRRYQWNPKRPTNVLSSTLYIASLSYEFNVFSLLRRKLNAAVDLQTAIASMPGSAQVVRSSAQSLNHLPDQSVEYIFTDPPFGSNIFYTDSSFLWEAWLDDLTDPTQEAVVHQSQRSEHGGKSLNDYEKLMGEAFDEMARVLRPNGWASVMFHNSSDEVWSALARAIETSGFEVGSAVAFDKSQASFKGLKGQLAGEKVPNFDLVLHLRRHSSPPRERKVPTIAATRARVEERLIAHVADAPPSRRTTPYLHSLAMRMLLEEQLPVDGFSYAAVEALCENVLQWDGIAWTTKNASELS